MRAYALHRTASTLRAKGVYRERDVKSLTLNPGDNTAKSKGAREKEPCENPISDGNCLARAFRARENRAAGSRSRSERKCGTVKSDSSLSSCRILDRSAM